MAIGWSKQTIPGTVEDNWSKIESFLTRLNELSASATKVVEGGDSHSGFTTTVIYPVTIVPAAEISLAEG